MFCQKIFLTFAVGTDKGFEFYRKIFELSPPYSTGATTLLKGGRHAPSPTRPHY